MGEHFKTRTSSCQKNEAQSRLLSASILRALFLLIFAFLCAASFSQAQEPATIINDIPGMIEEAKELAKRPPENNPWANHIVRQYIPLAVSKGELFPVLEEHGFEIHQTPEKYIDMEQYDEAYTASVHFWLFPRFLFMHEFRLLMDFRNDELANIRGRVFYQAL